MGKRIVGCILAMMLAGFGMTSPAAEPAPGASLTLPNATDADLAALKEKQDVLKLDVSCSKVTDAGLMNLKEMQGLQTLNLWRTQVTDAGLVYLKELKGLKWLSLCSTKVTDAGVANLKDMNSLQELNLMYTQVTDAGLVYLKDLKSLKTLCLEGTQLTGSGLANLKDLKELQTLYLGNTKMNDAGLEQLKELQGLRELVLYGTKVTDAGLARLTALQNLQTLNLANNEITGAGFAHLKEMKGLQVLDVGCPRLTDAGLVFLKEMKGLKSLSLSSSKVTDAGLAILKEMKGLEHLDLSGTKVTDDGLTQLKEMKGLQTLHLQGPRVTDVGIADLQAALPNTKIIGYGEKAVAPDRRALLLALVEKHSAEALSQLEVALGLDDPEHVNQYNHNVEQQFLVLGKDAFPIILELYRDPDFSLHSKLDDLLQSVGEDSAEFKSEAIRRIKLAQPDEFKRACWIKALRWFSMDVEDMSSAAAAALDNPADQKRVDALAERMAKEMPKFEFMVRPQGIELEAGNVEVQYCLEKFRRQLHVDVTAAAGLRPLPAFSRIDFQKSPEEFLARFAERVGGQLVTETGKFRIEPLALKEPGPPAPWTLVWQKNCPWPWLDTPVVADGKVLVQMKFGALSALDLRDGSELWKMQLPENHAIADLLVDAGVIYVGGGDNEMHAARLKDGKKLWSHQARTPWVGDMRPEHEIHVLGTQKGLVYFASTDGRFYALDAVTGTESWTSPAPCFDKPLKNQLPPLQWAGILAGETLYASGGGNLAALNLADHKLLWRTEGPKGFAPGILVRADRVYGAGEGVVEAYSVQDGSRVWRRDTNRKGEMETPLLIGEGLLVTTGDNYLYGIDPHSGELLWELNLPDVSRKMAVIGKDRIGLCLQNGELGIVDTVSHALVELRPLGVTHTGAPVLVGDMILVPSHIENGADWKKATGALSAYRPEGQKDAK